MNSKGQDTDLPLAEVQDEAPTGTGTRWSAAVPRGRGRAHELVRQSPLRAYERTAHVVFGYQSATAARARARRDHDGRRLAVMQEAAWLPHTPPRPGAAAGTSGGPGLWGAASPVFTPSQTPARAAGGGGPKGTSSDAGCGPVLERPTQQTRRGPQLRRELLRRAKRAARDADPAAAARVVDGRCAVVARAILTARAAASDSLLRLNRASAEQRGALEAQHEAACRCSAEALLRERQALSDWLLQSEWVRAARNSERADADAAAEAARRELARSVAEAQQKERRMEALVKVAQSERLAAVEERTQLLQNQLQLQQQAMAERRAHESAVRQAAVAILGDRAELSERALVVEPYTPGCRAPETALKLQTALCAQRTACAVATSGRLSEARDRIACRVADHAREEARHGCSLAEIRLSALRLRAELAFMGRLSDGPPYHTLCGAGVT